MMVTTDETVEVEVPPGRMVAPPLGLNKVTVNVSSFSTERSLLIGTSKNSTVSPESKESVPVVAV